MKDGRRSIYPDCYHGRHRSYDYLKLYLLPENDDESVHRNEAVMRKAEVACRKELRELKKLPTANKRVTETQDSSLKKDISLPEWLSRFKEIQRSRGVHDLHAIGRLCGALSGMNCGGIKVRVVTIDLDGNPAVENRLLVLFHAGKQAAQQRAKRKSLLK